MSADGIRGRNWPNASKSSGLKTAHDKAAGAGSARKHGTTARPDEDSAALWLAIINDDPESTSQDLPLEDDLGFGALAQAEAALDGAACALRTFAADHTHPLAPPEALRKASEQLIRAITEGTITVRGAQTFHAILPSLHLHALKNDRQRRSKRCHAEAPAQRPKAIRAWREAGGAAQSHREDASKITFPKTKPN